MDRAPSRAMTRGSPKRRAGALLPSVVTAGSATRSKAGLARTQPCPTRSVSSRRALTSRALACSSSRLRRRRWHRRSPGALTTVSIRSARPSFRFIFSGPRACPRRLPGTSGVSSETRSLQRVADVLDVRLGVRSSRHRDRGDAVIVHKVLAGSAESWTVLGEDGLPAEPAEAYLAHLAALERSPNTLRAYAHSLRMWLEFLSGQRIGWREAGVEQVARFAAWLRAPAANVIVLDAGEAARTAAPVNRHLAAFSGFMISPPGPGGGWPPTWSPGAGWGRGR